MYIDSVVQKASVSPSWPMTLSLAYRHSPWISKYVHILYCWWWDLQSLYKFTLKKKFWNFSNISVLTLRCVAAIEVKMSQYFPWTCKTSHLQHVICSWCLIGNKIRVDGICKLLDCFYLHFTQSPNFFGIGIIYKMEKREKKLNEMSENKNTQNFSNNFKKKCAPGKNQKD